MQCPQCGFQYARGDLQKKLSELADGSRSIQELADLTGRSYGTIAQSVAKMREGGQVVPIRYLKQQKTTEKTTVSTEPPEAA